MMVGMTVGQIVLTMYNNQTYRIDSIDFSKNPMSTFTKDGKEISYKKYYKDRYNLTIQDEGQPLLVSKATARQRRGGLPEEVYLIPELCRLTGVTDRMREDRRFMMDISAHTRVDPLGRQKRLMHFSQRMATSEQSQKHFQDFGMQLDKDLVKLKGRVLPPEKVHFRDGKIITLRKPDWTSEAQSNRMFSARIPLKNWYVLTMSRNRGDTEKFLKRLEFVSKGLGLEFHWPTM